MCIRDRSSGWNLHGTQLSQDPQPVEIRPPLHDQSVSKTEEVLGGERDPRAGRWNVHELGVVLSGGEQAPRDHVVLGDHVLDGDREVRKRSPESAVCLLYTSDAA